MKSEAYRQLDSQYREHFKRFVEEADYYDLFLISPQGEIVYTDAHEADFATNLITGPYRNSGLGVVAREALNTLQDGVSDFEHYSPSRDRIAAFMAFPIVVEGKLEGALALQIYSERVFQVVQDDVGLGASGETVLTRLLNERTALVMAPLKHEPDAALELKISFPNAPFFDSDPKWSARRAWGRPEKRLPWQGGGRSVAVPASHELGHRGQDGCG